VLNFESELVPLIIAKNETLWSHQFDLAIEEKLILKVS